MPKREDIKKIMLIGSGPIVIGQLASHSKRKDMKSSSSTAIPPLS